MGSLSDYAENKVVGHATLTAYTPVATVYLGLSTADPTDAATGASCNEVANSGSYARVAITFGAAASRRVTQSGGVSFPAATGSWSTITHWFLADSGTYGAGNVLASGAFASSFAVVSGNTRTIASGQIYVEITASTGFTTYFANGILDRIFRNQAFTISANYVGLRTTTSSDGTPGTEVSGTSYARVQVNASGGASPKWTAPSSGSVNNADAVNFATPGGSWGNVKGVSVYDASSSGNELFYGDDVVDQDVGTETTSIGFAAGALVVAQS